MKIHRRHAVTLIELLVAISITTLLVGVVVLMMQTSFDAYIFGQQQVLLEKVLDESLEEIISGGIEGYGIKNALEIIHVSPTSITFVPLWVDTSHKTKQEHTNRQHLPNAPFILNRPFKAGASIPIAETIHRVRGATRLQQVTRQQLPIVFAYGPANNAQLDDKIFLKDPLPAGRKINFIFHPDVTHFPDAAMTIGWEDGVIKRRYQGITETVPVRPMQGVRITDLRLHYFDNTNHEIDPTKENIPRITGVKVVLHAAVQLQGKRSETITQQGTAFISIRNVRSAGSGLIIQEGTTLPIPDSRTIRVFSLAHVVGVHEADRIELEARSSGGDSWKIVVEFGLKDSQEIIKRYAVESPIGTVVYGESVNLTTDLPLNFLTLGADGRYDYDFDKGGSNVVVLEGDVTLRVTRMDPSGAALFIRP